MTLRLGLSTLPAAGGGCAGEPGAAGSPAPAGPGSATAVLSACACAAAGAGQASAAPASHAHVSSAIRAFEHTVHSFGCGGTTSGNERRRLGCGWGATVGEDLL